MSQPIIETEECIYCGQMTPVIDAVPDAADDDAWQALAEFHDEYCEWILTRAHRRP